MASFTALTGNGSSNTRRFSSRTASVSPAASTILDRALDSAGPDAVVSAAGAVGWSPDVWR